ATTGGSNPVSSFAAKLPPVSLPAVPTVPDVTSAAPPAKIKDNGGATQNLERNSLNFTPKGIDGKPFLFGSGGGVDNGMPGWQKGLKSLGIGGDTGGADGGGASAPK
ncbi:MAG: hypothetical protein QOJ28_2187, partial [Mycobacterium sp.]|nr:hypothetical protein [Mycobacterium sp.]